LEHRTWPRWGKARRQVETVYYVAVFRFVPCCCTDIDRVVVDGAFKRSWEGFEEIQVKLHV